MISGCFVGSVLVNSMKESIEFRVLLLELCVGVSVGVGLIGWDYVSCVRLLVCLTHPPSQLFVPSVRRGYLNRSSTRIKVRAGFLTSWLDLWMGWFNTTPQSPVRRQIVDPSPWPGIWGVIPWNWLSPSFVQGC